MIPVDRTGPVQVYALQQPATTFEEPIFPFTQLGRDPQRHIISWIGPVEGSRLSITCKTAYVVWQKIFLADGGGAGWIVKKIIESSRCRFEEALNRIERRIMTMEAEGDPRVQILFAKLLEYHHFCTLGPMTDDTFALIKNKCAGDEAEELNFTGTDCPPQQLLSIVSHCKSLKKLDLSGYRHNGIDAVIGSMVDACACTLEGLYLGNTLVSDGPLSVIGKGATQLRSLDLSRCWNVTGAGISAVTKQLGGTLAALRIDGTRVSDEGLASISEYCTQLKTLTLPRFYVTGITTEGITNVMRERGSTLEELALSGEISDLELSAISNHCTQLRILNLSACPNISDDGIAAVAKRCGSTLRQLNLPRTRISDVGLQAIAKHCSLLENLDLGECTDITDAGLGYVMSGCKALKTLHLDMCQQLSGACFASILEDHASLRELDLMGCVNVTSENLVVLSKRCTNLVFLDLHGAVKAGSALESIIRNCSQLEYLRFDAIPEISRESLLLMAEYRLPLKSLGLGGCIHVTDEVIGLLAQSYPNLQTLSLNFTPISDVSLEIIAEHLPKLAKLAIAGCIVSDKGLEVLMSSCTYLEELSIIWTPISDAGLESIVKYGARLKKLSCNDMQNITYEGRCWLESSLKGVEFL